MTAVGRRWALAMSKALSTSSVRGCSAMAQPTTRRLKASTTTARHTRALKAALVWARAQGGRWRQAHSGNAINQRFPKAGQLQSTTSECPGLYSFSADADRIVTVIIGEARADRLGQSAARQLVRTHV